jgi:hypothetical protein
MKTWVLAVAMALPLTAFADSAPRLVVDCGTAAIFDEGTPGKPAFTAVAEQTLRGKLVAAPYSGLRLEVIPQEEIHFQKPGFHLEVLTNRDSWSAGELPGIDEKRPERAPGHLWLGDDHAGSEVDCTFYR